MNRRQFTLAVLTSVVRGVADRYPYVPDLNGPDHMQVIADELAKRGQPGATIEKVLRANFQRIIGEIWSSA